MLAPASALPNRGLDYWCRGWDSPGWRKVSPCFLALPHVKPGGPVVRGAGPPAFSCRGFHAGDGAPNGLGDLVGRDVAHSINRDKELELFVRELREVVG